MLHVVGTIGLAARFVLALILHIDLLEVALASAGFYLFLVSLAVHLLIGQYLIALLHVSLMISLSSRGSHTLVLMKSANHVVGTH